MKDSTFQKSSKKESGLKNKIISENEIFYDVFEEVPSKKISAKLESDEGYTQSLIVEKDSGFEKISIDQIPSSQDFNEIPEIKYNIYNSIKYFN
ncbi:MAG: hypothetical protein ABI045_01605 [Flavobacteriales bacterium]